MCPQSRDDVIATQVSSNFYPMCKIPSAKLLSVLLVILLLPHFLFATKPNGAFCRRNTTGVVDFPLSVPKTFLTPWVWDAIENAEQKTVEITIVSRRACWFNHTLWGWATKMLPNHAKSLGYGLRSSILVEAEASPDFLLDPFARERESIYGERVNCMYYNNGSFLPVSQTRSQIIDGTLKWLRYSTVQIICPTSDIKFDEMRIERITRKSVNGSLVIPLKSQKNDLIVSITEKFPVCHLSDLKKEIINTNIDYKGRYYGISVCTATARINRKNIVEWIEYHKHLGVDHFYIYLTSMINQHNIAYTILSDYIAEGIVTITPWGYENCVKGMASGRWCHWRNNTLSLQERATFFQPPRAISQTAALSSCYSRYKKFSKYIMHIDDDEFVVMNSDLANPISKIKIEQKKIKRKRKKFRGALYDYANQIFSKNPNAAAIQFSPVDKYYCPKMNNINIHNNNKNIPIKGFDSYLHLSRNSTMLPRIGKNLISKFQFGYEVKLLMKTKAVKMFFIHYLTQLEKPYTSYDPIQTSMSDIVLLHYKVAPFINGDIWGQMMLNKPWTKESRLCSDFRNYGGYKEDIPNGYYQPIGNNSNIYPIPPLNESYIQRIDFNSKYILETNYQNRILKLKI